MRADRRNECKRRDDMDQIPCITDPVGEQSLGAKYDTRYKRDDRGQKGHVPGELDVRHWNSDVPLPMPELIPGERQQEEHAGDRMNKNGYLVWNAEW